MVLVRKNPEHRGPATSWDVVQVEPAWTGAGMVHKGRVEVRPQEAAVLCTHPSTRLEVTLPRGKGKRLGLAVTCWDLWAQVLKVQCGTSKDFGLGLVWLTLREHTSHSPGFWGDSHKGFQGLPSSPDCTDVGKQVWRVLFYTSFFYSPTGLHYPRDQSVL